MRRYLRHLRRFCDDRRVHLEEVRYPIPAGTTTGVWLDPPRRRGVVLVCHGLGSDRYYPFVELFEDLLRAGHAVLSVDLDGHGTGNRHLLSGPAVELTIPWSLAHLRRRHGIEAHEVVVLGQSLGGALALAESTRNACAGVIAISAPHTIELDPGCALEVLAALSPNALRQLRYWGPYELLPAFQGFKRALYPCRTTRPDGDYIRDAAEMVARLQVVGRVARSRVPLLQIHGTRDRVVPVQQAHDVARHYGGPVEREVVPGANHFTTLFTPRCRRAIRVWLDRRTTSASVAA